MPLTPFVDSAGSLDMNAAVEQMSLSRALYNRNVSGVGSDVKAAGGDYVKLAENTTVDNWVTAVDPLPAYVVFAHDGKVWVVVQGTYSATQWFSNVIGALNTGNLGTNGGTFQQAWARMAVRVYAALTAAQGALNNAPLNLSGHSLGGVVAWMVGALAKQDTPDRRVDVMTFGSPRPEAGSYSGSKPASDNDVQIQGDPVVYLPPNLTTSSVNRWQQQGTKTILDTRGVVLDPATNDGEISASLLFGSGFNKHLPSTYGDALNSQYIRGTRSSFTTALLVTAGYLDKSWIDVPAKPGPPPTPEIPGGPPTPVATHKLDQLRGSDNMPNAAFQVTFHYNCGQTGWGEEYIWTSADLRYNAALADAKALNNVRMAFSASSVVLAGISFAELALDAGGLFVKGDVRPTSYTEYDFTGTEVAGTHVEGATTPQNCYFIIARSLTRDRTRIIKLKGIADKAMAVTDVNIFAHPVGSLSIANLIAYYRVLLGSANQDPGPQVKNQGVWSIGSRTYRRNKADRTGIDNVSVVAYRNRSLFQIEVDGLGLAVGDRIHVGGIRGPGTAGINGDATVLQVGTVGTIQQVTLNHPPRCGGDILPTSFGYVSKVGNNLAAIADVTIMKVGEAKVGRPHGGIRGRRSAPRC